MVNYNRLSYEQAQAAEALISIMQRLMPGVIISWSRMLNPLHKKLNLYSFKFVSKSRKIPTQAGWGPSVP